MTNPLDYLSTPTIGRYPSLGDAGYEGSGRYSRSRMTSSGPKWVWSYTLYTPGHRVWSEDAKNTDEYRT